jgi:LPXTG-motif cell wall-anchored protein
VSASATGSGSASPSPVPSTGLDCTFPDDSDAPAIDENLTTSIDGLPSKIVAGSGWHGFSLGIANSSDTSYKRVDLGIFAASIDNNFNDTSGHLTLQWQDPDSGKWIDVSLDANDVGAGYVGWTNVDPHDSFSLKLRLNVDKSAPDGLGFTLSAGVYANDKGECVISGGVNSVYQFDILAAGTDPGNVDDSKPQTGGKKPIPAKPAGDTEIGSLADTGSSSALPMIALAGGAAVVVGGGAMFVVRRRKTGTPA